MLQEVHNQVLLLVRAIEGKVEREVSRMVLLAI